MTRITHNYTKILLIFTNNKTVCRNLVAVKNKLELVKAYVCLFR